MHALQVIDGALKGEVAERLGRIAQPLPGQGNLLAEHAQVDGTGEDVFGELRRCREVGGG